MKILFLSASSSIHTVRWVNALVEIGHEVILVSKVDHHEECENAISKKVKVIYLPIKGMKGYYLNAIALKRLYKKADIDVINVHYASGYGTLARIARLPHILLSVWGSDVYDFPYESKIKKYILKKNLEYADIIASTSVSMGAQTAKFLKHKKDIKITPFGVDIQKFAPKFQQFDNEKFVFGIVKTLAKKYGISVVIRAFALFLDSLSAKERKNVSLEIYGKGELLEELQYLVEKKELDGQVFFRGYISNNEVPSVLHKMNAFVLGSVSESFGVSAIEAMACGLPVIATKVSGFQEVIEDNETGFLVPVNNVKEMAEKMLKVYENKELRERMGRKGRQRVEKLFDWEKNVATMVKVYEELKR